MRNEYDIYNTTGRFNSYHIEYLNHVINTNSRMGMKIPIDVCRGYYNVYGVRNYIYKEYNAGEACAYLNYMTHDDGNYRCPNCLVNSTRWHVRFDGNYCSTVCDAEAKVFGRTHHISDTYVDRYCSFNKEGYQARETMYKRTNY